MPQCGIISISRTSASGLQIKSYPTFHRKGNGVDFLRFSEKMEHYFIFHYAIKRTADANRSGHAEQINLAGP
jgi:hypothetical protein